MNKKIKEKLENPILKKLCFGAGFLLFTDSYSFFFQLKHHYKNQLRGINYNLSFIFLLSVDSRESRNIGRTNSYHRSNTPKFSGRN